MGKQLEKKEIPYSYKISDVAEALQISRWLAYELVRKRKIPGGYRLGDLWRVRGKIFRDYLEKLGEQPNYRLDEETQQDEARDLELTAEKRAAG